MENVNKTMLVHVGMELVVIGGLTFWFQKKISIQQERVNNLEERLAKLEEIIVKQGNIIAQHENMFRQLGSSSQIPSQHNHRHNPSHQAPSHQVPNQSTSIHNHPQQHIHRSRDNPRPQPEYIEEIDEESEDEEDLEEEDEEDLDEGDLDDLLKDEIKSIHKNRGEDSENIELECEDGVCSLKKQKKRTKDPSSSRVGKKKTVKKK